MKHLRQCRVCKIKAFTESDLENFINDKTCKHNKKQLCKDCHVKTQRARVYNVDIEYYETVLKEQDYSCAICGTKEDLSNGKARGFALDHCHTTGKARGLLCFRCNTAIGLFDDKKDNLLKAIEYLAKY